MMRLSRNTLTLLDQGERRWTATTFNMWGALSNAHVGNEFEDAVCEYFRGLGLSLTRGFKVPVRVGDTKKPRKFDWKRQSAHS